MMLLITYMTCLKFYKSTIIYRGNSRELNIRKCVET